jgi:molecular chaperone GrpE
MNRKATKTANMKQKNNDVKEKQTGSPDFQDAGLPGDTNEVQDNKSWPETEIENQPGAEDEQEGSGNDLNIKLEAAEGKARESQDKYLRLSAEFDNYRKRTLKEKADLLRYANEDILKDLLSIIDDFDRGLQIIDKSEDVVALKEGIHLIYNKFNEFTKQNGIKEIQAMDQVFDIDFHEAMTKIPATSEELKGKVVDVIEKGYMLGDKVIRYAKVVVGE